MYARDSYNSKRPRARHTRSRRDLLSMPRRSRPEAGGWADLRQILASSSTAVHIRQRASFARRDLQYASSAICMTASAAICFGFMAFIRQAKRGAARLKKSKHRPLLSCIQRGRHLKTCGTENPESPPLAQTRLFQWRGLLMPNTLSTKCTKYPFRESFDFHARMAARLRQRHRGATRAWGLGQGSDVCVQHFSPEEQWRAEAPVRCPIAASGTCWPRRGARLGVVVRHQRSTGIAHTPWCNAVAATPRRRGGRRLCRHLADRS